MPMLSANRKDQLSQLLENERSFINILLNNFKMWLYFMFPTPHQNDRTFTPSEIAFL